MKNIFIAGMLIFASTVHCHNIQTRAAYFIAPTALYYTYQMLDRLSNSCHHGLYAYAQNSPFALVVAFQGLTYYCWAQAFKPAPKNPDNQYHVTITHH